MRSAVFVGALSLVAVVGCHRTHGDRAPAAPRVLKSWKGHVAAANLDVGILWFSPRAGIDSAALQAEAKQIFDDNGGSTESFVFARGHDGAWQYTEQYDAQFARLGL